MQHSQMTQKKAGERSFINLSVRLDGQEASTWKGIVVAVRAEKDIPGLPESEVLRILIREAGKARGIEAIQDGQEASKAKRGKG